MFLLLPWKLEESSRPADTLAAANLLLIVIHVLVFVCGGSWPVQHGSAPTSILLYGFSHAGWWHLIINILALWVFGNTVNRRLGNSLYLAVYLGVILCLGMLAWRCIPLPVVGSSGGLFAIIVMAALLEPGATLRVFCLATFPLTIIIGLFASPKQTFEWFVCWRQLRLPMLSCPAGIPVLLAWEVVFSGWNWGTVAHLLGTLLGVAVVVLLPVRITMCRRSLVGI